MATTKDDLSDKHVDTASAEVGEASGAGDDVLLVEGNTRLSLTDKDLVVTRPSKKRRTCGIFPARNPAPTTIPLYNVLWAEFVSESLSITYADPNSKHLRPATLTFAPPDSDPTSAAASFASTLLRRAYGRAALRKRAKVLVNPHAGPGGADKLWEHDASPIFRAARITSDVVRTEYSGQGVDIAREVDIEAYDMIVACSGDGLPHEIFNGLGKRADARRALGRLAVAHVPCGSGNAMSCNLYGTPKAAPAALAIVKGVATPMDLVSITQGAEGKRYLSFLSQSLGIVAESDLATEHMRWMGEARFTVGFLQRVFRGKVYPCEVAMKVEVEGKDNIREHYRRAKGLGVEGKGEADGDGEGEGEGGVEGEGEGLPELKYGSVGDKVPEGWEVISHDKLGNFYCGNMAYMAPEANFFPASLPSDGLADLVTVRGDLGALASLSLMMSVEGGGLFDDERVEYRKVSAFRVCPRDGEGYVSVDGERVPFEAFQGEVHRGLGRVISAGGFAAPGPRGWDA